MTIARLMTSSAFAAMVSLAIPTTAGAQEREMKLTGFGAMSGVVRSFGINSKAALEAAADEVNKGGGVKLGDGTKGKFVVDYFDDRCNAEEGISVTRRMASSPTLVGIGPTCSNVAEPLFGILQKKVGDAGDSGLQFPIFTDVAIKGGLAKISEWAFRNVPDEGAMYRELFSLDQEDASGTEVGLRRRRRGLRALARDLVRGHEGSGGKGRLRGQG